MVHLFEGPKTGKATGSRTPIPGLERRRSHGRRLLAGYLSVVALVLVTGSVLPPAGFMVARSVVSFMGVAALAVGIWWHRPAASSGG